MLESILSFEVNKLGSRHRRHSGQSGRGMDCVEIRKTGDHDRWPPRRRRMLNKQAAERKGVMNKRAISLRKVIR